MFIKKHKVKIKTKNFAGSVSIFQTEARAVISTNFAKEPLRIDFGTTTRDPTTLVLSCNGINMESTAKETEYGNRNYFDYTSRLFFTRQVGSVQSR